MKNNQKRWVSLLFEKNGWYLLTYTLLSKYWILHVNHNIASLKHATYKLEEKSIITITNMERGKKNLFAFLE